MKIEKVAIIIGMIFVSSVLFSGCGKSKKKPVDDLSDLDTDIIDADETDDDVSADLDELTENETDVENDFEEEDDSVEIEPDDDDGFIPDNDDSDMTDADEPGDLDEIIDDSDQTDIDAADDDVNDDALTDEDFADEDVTDDEVGDYDIGDPEVLCSGIDKCYDNTGEITCPESGDFFGQDYQYALQGVCTPQNFVVSGTAPEEIVEDTFTGLFWQRTLPDIYPGCTGGATEGELCQWAQAESYCDALEYGGFDDWRLPTAVEISTLPNYGKYIPAIDDTAFPDTAPSYFWTSTTHAQLGDNAWLGYFIDGNVDRYLKTKNYYVRCVRGETYNNGNSFIKISVSDESFYIDEKTNLSWADTYSTAQTWQGALNYCETLNYAGSSDWRLPNVNELKTLVDYSLKTPATPLSGMPSQPFWSSTGYLGYGEYGWFVNFMYGEVYYHTKSNYYHARCVR